MGNSLLDGVLVSIATILVILGVETHFKQYLLAYSVPLIVVGLLILVLGKLIIKDFQTSFMKRFASNATGTILLVVGVEYFLEKHMASYWVMYIILGLVLFQWHKEISNLIQ